MHDLKLRALHESILVHDVVRLLADGVSHTEVVEILHAIYGYKVAVDTVAIFHKERFPQLLDSVQRFDELRRSRERDRLFQEAFSISLDLPPVLAGLCVDLHEIEADNRDLRERVLKARDTIDGPDVPLENVLRQNRLLALDFRKTILSITGITTLPAVEGIARDVAVLAVRIFCSFLPESDGRFAVNLFKTELARLIG